MLGPLFSPLSSSRHRWDKYLLSLTKSLFVEDYSPILCIDGSTALRCTLLYLIDYGSGQYKFLYHLLGLEFLPNADPHLPPLSSTFTRYILVPARKLVCHEQSQWIGCIFYFSIHYGSLDSNSLERKKSVSKFPTSPGES